MAETVAEPIEGAPIPAQEPEERRRPGRPRKERDVKADTGQGDVGESFFDGLKALEEKDWKDLYTVYLYRCEPFTDRKVTGNDNFIMKYTQPIDQQSVMEEYGSGKYLAVLNLFNPSTRHSKAVYSHYFRIMNTKYPPQLPLGEWINDGRNKDWAWAKPLLEEAEAKRLQNLHAAGASAGMDQAADMFKAAVAAVKDLRPDAAPDEQNSLAVQVIQSMEKSADRMLTMANPAQFMGLVEKILSVNKNEGGGVMQLVMAQLSAIQGELSKEREFSRDLLVKLSTPAVTEPKKSFKEELLDMKEVMGMLRGNSGGSKTDWGEVAVTFGEKVLTVGAQIAQAVIMARAQNANQRRAPQPVRFPTDSPAIESPANPDQQADQSQQTMQPNPNYTPEQQQMANQLETLNNTFGPVFDMAAPHIVDCFHKSDGVDFREWFLGEFGEFAYREMRRVGPEMILGVFELRKQVAPPHVQTQLQQLQPPEKVQQFVLEFLSDEPAEGDEDEDTEKPGTAEERKPVRKDF